MKAAERKRKRLEEKNKLNSMIDMNEMPKKKLISNQENIINSKEINNTISSRPANNIDLEKINQKKRERMERRKRKKMIEAGLDPNDVDSNNNYNNNDSIIDNININNNVNNINDINNINRNNTFFNNKKYIIDKDSNKLVYSVEPFASAAGLKRVNFKIPSNKTLNLENNFNLNNNNINIMKQNTNSISNSLNNDILSTASVPNYQILSKNFANIKNENVEEFLTKTNPKKPTIEQKETEVQAMIQVMNLRPNPKNPNNLKNINDSNYAHNLTQKIEDNNEYYESQKEIMELKKIEKEEENKMEQMLERNKEEIQRYIEKILKLQNDLINSNQGDIIALEDENKIDEIQIYNLQMNLQRLEEENEKEKNKMLYLINKEITPLQKELKSEILEVQKLKKQLLQWNKKTPPRDLLRKIEVVMKYMKNCS